MISDVSELHGEEKVYELRLGHGRRNLKQNMSSGSKAISKAEDGS